MKDNSEKPAIGSSDVGLGGGFTHVEGDGDDVEAHGGVSDAAEGRRLKGQEDHSAREGQVEHPSCFLQEKWPEQPLTRSILASLCLRRRRLCLRINCEEELCSVELLSLKR